MTENKLNYSITLPEGKTYNDLNKAHDEGSETEEALHSLEQARKDNRDYYREAVKNAQNPNDLDHVLSDFRPKVKPRDIAITTEFDRYTGGVNDVTAQEILKERIKVEANNKELDFRSQDYLLIQFLNALNNSWRIEDLNRWQSLIKDADQTYNDFKKFRPEQIEEYKKAVEERLSYLQDILFSSIVKFIQKQSRSIPQIYAWLNPQENKYSSFRQPAYGYSEVYPQDINFDFCNIRRLASQLRPEQLQDLKQIVNERIPQLQDETFAYLQGRLTGRIYDFHYDPFKIYSDMVDLCDKVDVYLRPEQLRSLTALAEEKMNEQRESEYKYYLKRIQESSTFKDLFTEAEWHQLYVLSDSQTEVENRKSHLRLEHLKDLLESYKVRLRELQDGNYMLYQQRIAKASKVELVNKIIQIANLDVYTSDPLKSRIRPEQLKVLVEVAQDRIVTLENSQK